MIDPAYAHYTVGRETSEAEATRRMIRRNVFRKGWKALKHRATHRIPGIEKDPRVDADITMVVRDVVRINDRTGGIVFEALLDRRALSEALEHQITSDLLAMDVETFRAKYRIDAHNAQG